jgi:hypothetical protein
MGLEVEINRMAAIEAVSLETNLALVAKRRGELSLMVAHKQAEEPKPVPEDGAGLNIDKIA